ncbi:hypothetical protein ABPG74_003843 [Tetrahymena malaccensis]
MIKISVVLFCFLVLGVNCFNNSTKFNSRPFIGIYTAPSTYSKFPGLNYSYIAASYVKFVESAGAQAVPIPYDATLEYLDTLFSKINGILFPGGSVEFTFDDSVDKIFSRNANYLIQKAKNATDQGDFFPIWGTCQGFELIHYIESGFNSTVLKSGYNDTTSHPTKKIDNSSKLFEKMPAFLKNHMKNFPYAYYHHDKGVIPQSYVEIPKLSQNYRYTSMGYTDSHREFIATFEAINYPIFGTQFHPEKNAFEWKIEAARDFKSTLVSQYFANFFVQQAKQNFHSFNGTSDENKYLIYQYPTYSLATSSYTEIYILKNFGNPEVDYTQAYVPKTKKSKSLIAKMILQNQFEDDEGF